MHHPCVWYAYSSCMFAYPRVCYACSLRMLCLSYVSAPDGGCSPDSLQFFNKMFLRCTFEMLIRTLSLQTSQLSRIRRETHTFNFTLTQLSINLTHCTVNLKKKTLDYHAELYVCVTADSSCQSVSEYSRNSRDYYFTN